MSKPVTNMVELRNLYIQEWVSQYQVLDFGDAVNKNTRAYLGQGNRNFSVAASSGFRTTMNQVQPAVTSNWGILANDPVKLEVCPRVSGGPPLYYFNTGLNVPMTPALQSTLAGMDPETQQQGQPINPAAYTPDETGDVQPLTAAEADSLQNLIDYSQWMSQQAQMQNNQPGMPRVRRVQPIPSELIVKVDDKTCAEAFQEVLDIMWDKSNMSFYLRENILYNIINGYQFMVYEWDEDGKCPVVWNPESMMVRLDMTRTDVGRSAWVMVDYLLSVDEAKSKFPGVDPAVIQANSTRSPIQSQFDGTIYPLWYRSGTFERDMCVLSNMFLRYQPFPMDVNDALAAGYIVPGHPDAPEPERPGVLARIGSALGMGADDESAEPAPDDKSAEPPQPTLLRHAKTNAIVGTIGPDGVPVPDTTHADYPVRYGVLHVQIITNGSAGGVEISRKECEFSNIPVLQNVNIPIPQCPLGQGEPSRMIPMQLLLDDVLTNLAAASCGAAFPVQLIARSAFEAIKEKNVNSMYVTPGKYLVIDDDLAKMIGGLENGFKVLDAPQVPEALFKLAQMLVGLLKQESDRLDSPSPEGGAWSGTAIEAAQAPNKGVVTAKGLRIEQMLKYYAELVWGDITSPVRLSAQELNRICPKFPIQVWEAFQERQKNLLVDFTVEITSGSGTMKSKKVKDALAQYNNGSGPVNLPSTLEALGKDPEAELQKQVKYNQLLASSQQQQAKPGAAVAPGAAPGPQQQVTAAPTQPQAA